MKLQMINNWKYKGHWSNLCHVSYNKGYFDIRHLLVGFFGFFLFVVW